MTVDIQKMMAGKMQMEAAIQAEIRATARDLFVGMMVPYLRRCTIGIAGAEQLRPVAIKQLADLAMKSAPYLHQAAGMVQIDDEQVWGPGV